MWVQKELGSKNIFGPTKFTHKRSLCYGWKFQLACFKWECIPRSSGWDIKRPKKLGAKKLGPPKFWSKENWIKIFFRVQKIGGCCPTILHMVSLVGGVGFSHWFSPQFPLGVFDINPYALNYRLTLTFFVVEKIRSLPSSYQLSGGLTVEVVFLRLSSNRRS